MEKISLIIPCYNEEEALPPLYEELKRVTAEMSEYEFEMLFIDDGSKDKTLQKLKELAQEDGRVQYISFSRNFGKEAAMYAGFCNVRGDYVAVMDADMQDPPALLPKMLEIIKNGEYDSVATRRISRKGEPKVRSLFANIFYKLMKKISDVDIVNGARDFRLMKRKMVDAIVSMSEYNRFSKGIFGWIGFKTYWLPYENVKRVAGKTKWSFWKLLRYSIDGIMNFSETPLKLASWSGIFFTFAAVVALLVVFIRALVYGNPVAGWPSTICIILFVGGVQLFCIGVMGQYISKIYKETKKRPQYIVGETNKEDVVHK
ncbi:MAG: glycosyltransferase family 2 protein [Clostridiales bacterium]|nr:glycosyltransferase family 2 protein [Clostridiales bacterium]